MAKGYKLNGLSAIQEKIRNLPKEIRKEMVADIEDAADAIVNKAITLVPVDLGVLKQSIGNEPKDGGLNYIVFVGAEYGPFVEWGAGNGVSIPTELQEYAKQFQSSNGTRNIQARPFFFPGYFQERDALIKKLKADLAKLVK